MNMVMLKGTTVGTTTNNSGHYFLKNLPEDKFTREVKPSMVVA
ncbi:hypothetical protein [Parabacteroides gordonii]|nr:hypothetical protein [Parabacteroides gordonii]